MAEYHFDVQYPDQPCWWENETVRFDKEDWEDLPRDDFNQERMTSDRVEGIDAKAVLKLFDAKDYYELLDRIKERFHERTAYDDFLAYLRENGITIQ